MKLKFEKQKGYRIKSRFIGATARGNSNIWYNTTLNKWEDRNIIPYNEQYGYSTHAPCRSIRAFRKMLSKLPNYYKLELVSRYIGGNNVIGNGSRKNK